MQRVTRRGDRILKELQQKPGARCWRDRELAAGSANQVVRHEIAIHGILLAVDRASWRTQTIFIIAVAPWLIDES
jgi:hypothetical protein